MPKKQKVIGLDIGSSEIRCVEISTMTEETAITGFAYAPVDEEMGVQKAISAALTRGGLKTRRVVTAVAGRLVPVRYVTMPRMPVEKLKEAVQVEANKYIPFDVDQAVIDCEPLVEEPPAEGEKPSPEITVRLIAAKRDIIEDHVTLLSGAGVYPLIIDQDCFALGNAFEFKEMYKSEDQREKRVVALVDVGCVKSSINVMSGINSYFTREVPGGGSELTEAIARRLSVPNDQAEELKRNPGERAEEVMEAMLGPLDDLMSEISLSFDYFESQHDKVIEEVFASGGTCQLPGILDVFEQHFGKPISLWDPLEGLELQLPENQLAQLKEHSCNVAIAIGLAARINGLP